ncbi:MAG: alpha/beta hydrolase [Rhodocyclaceae bacterium]
MIQNRLIYYPDNIPLAAAVEEARRSGFAPWPSEADFRGWVREPEGTVRATAVLFHGNAGHAGHRAWYGGILLPHGLRLILAEYPGYGPRSGAPGERALVADATEIVRLAQRQFPGPLLLVGESLGAGVAAAAAARGEVLAVLLITPWDRLDQVARHHYPWLPVSLLLNDRYDSVEQLSAYRGRIAVVVAAQDSIVPPERGKALFERLAAPKHIWTIPGAEHNDWMMHVDGEWWRSVVGFLLGD